MKTLMGIGTRACPMNPTCGDKPGHDARMWFDMNGICSNIGKIGATMRIMLIATAAAAAILLHPGGSQAYEGPWCALSDIGGGTMHENCSMRSLEMCRQEVIAGNRGFCNPNPRWQGNRQGARQKTGARRKRVDY
jgi:hypothetical protein